MSRRGSVLLATLLVVLLIYGLVTLSAASSRRMLEVTRHARIGLQADYLARGGLHWGMKRLADPGWAEAHTGRENAATVTIDPEAPTVDVWLEATSAPELFELRASCSERSAAAVLSRAPSVQRRLYAGAPDGTLQEFDGAWHPLPSPPRLTWTGPAAPALDPTLASLSQLRGDDQGNLAALSEDGSVLYFDRAAGLWKLLPPIAEDEVTAVALDAAAVYAVAGRHSPLISAIGGPVEIPIAQSFLYRLDNPAQAGWAWNGTAWTAGTGAWARVADAPADLGRVRRAALSHGQLYLGDAQARRIYRYDGAWHPLPAPPNTLYGRDGEQKLHMTGHVVEGDSVGFIVGESFNTIMHGGCETDPEGNLYWYAEPEGTTEYLPTLYRYAGGTWKLAAFPVDQVYDSSGALVSGQPRLFDLTVAPDGELVLGYGGGGRPTFYQYDTSGALEQPGRPAIPPLPGVVSVYDPSQPGLCRFDPGTPPTQLKTLASGGIRQSGRFDYRVSTFLTGR